jgi:thioredoxin reductase/Fe-S-cluster-containing dehydrogenase component
MDKPYDVVIVGSGPAGLGAASRAADRGLHYVLLEAESHIAHTIYQYQKGKHVMAEPGVLPLHSKSKIGFEAGTREQVRAVWEARAKDLAIQFNTKVESIASEAGVFCLKVRDSGKAAELYAQSVVLAIGLQGNLNKLKVPGAARVEYQLDDADRFSGEKIVVVGVGDSAIENAIALAKKNKVVIVNRREEFDRAKSGNSSAIKKNIKNGNIDYVKNSETIRIEELESGSASNCSMQIIFKSVSGDISIVPCNRIIARLGAAPPRGFLESCGIQFKTKDKNALPVISDKYETNMAGLYAIGALAGSPLIKEAMNQGFEVIEHICGEKVAPADELILKNKLRILPGFKDVNTALKDVRSRISLISELTELQLREFMRESNILLKPRRADPELQLSLPRKISKVDELVREGRSLLVLARLNSTDGGMKIHIRIFDAGGTIVMDQAEDDFIRTEGLLGIKERLGSAVDTSDLSEKERRRLLADVMAFAGYTSRVFERNEYSDTFFSILVGEVKLHLDSKSRNKDISLSVGNCFGEIGLISGRRQPVEVTASDGCVLIETPRRTMNKLIKSVESVRVKVDDLFVKRALQMELELVASDEELARIAVATHLERYDVDQIIYQESTPGKYDCRLLRVNSVDGLASNGRGLVTVVLVDTKPNPYLHLRIFNSRGEKVYDKPEREFALGQLDAVNRLKRRFALDPAFSDRFNDAKLLLTKVSRLGQLPSVGKSLVVVALVGNERTTHILAFDEDGKVTINKGEGELIGGTSLQYLKKRLQPLPDDTGQLEGYECKVYTSASDLPQDGRNLVAVTAGGPAGPIHIRVFDASTDKVVDKPEGDLQPCESFSSLKKLLGSIGDGSAVARDSNKEIMRAAMMTAFESLSASEKQQIVGNAIAVAALVLTDDDKKAINADAAAIAEHAVPTDSFYFIRSGSVTLSRRLDGKDHVLSYVPAGHFIGIEGIFNDFGKFETARAAIASEIIRIERDALVTFLEKTPNVRKRVRADLQRKLADQIQTFKVQSSNGEESIIPFLTQQGATDATNVLLIDESLCIRCDNCEKACAETHDGVSRLDREAGPTFAQIHVPTSCRHCEHPHCMADCPPNALVREPDGEITIKDSCIGCGNCERNCPYGVIKMAPKVKPPAINVLSWILFGKSRQPGDEIGQYLDEGKLKEAKKVATKCDLCKGLKIPACVRACPTGAAIRVEPEEYIKSTQQEAL